MAKGKDLFSPKQMAALADMEQAASEITSQINAVEAFGLDMSDRRSQNMERLAACGRAREIQAAHNMNNKGMQ